MANPERVVFGLSLASSSSELMNASMTSFESYVLVFLSVGCPAIRSDFSAAISVLQSTLLYFLPLFYTVRDSLRRPLKRVGDSRSRFLNEIAFSISQWFWHKIEIPGSPESKHWPYCWSNRERAHYYMSIMKEAHYKMRNNGESDGYGWTIQAVWHLTSKGCYLSKCGWLFRKGEWAFYTRIPVEAQW